MREFFTPTGHVPVYHGKLTNLPRRYVARERLCLRATTDYWVNAMDERPFFMVSCAVDPGLLKVLREQIVPRLSADVPNQPTPEQLKAEPFLSRFTIVFDREGYSPDFFAQMKAAHCGPDLPQVCRRALSTAGIPALPGPLDRWGTSHHGNGRTRPPTLQLALGA